MSFCETFFAVAASLSIDHCFCCGKTGLLDPENGTVCACLSPLCRWGDRVCVLSRCFASFQLFFLLIALWSRHVKPSSAKGEKRLKRKKITKFVQAEALPESEIMYKSKDRCTGMKDRITRDREIQRYAKTYQKPSPQTSVHLEQQVELRKKVESGSTIADIEAA